MTRNALSVVILPTSLKQVLDECIALFSTEVANRSIKSVNLVARRLGLSFLQPCENFCEHLLLRGSYTDHALEVFDGLATKLLPSA
jgi:hypothetical protein